MSHRLTEKTFHQKPKIFLFICHFPSVEDRSGGIIYPVNRQILLTIVISGLILPSASADLFPSSGPVVSGKTARLRFGKAAAPKNAPVPVKRAIWAANQLRSKPYRYGGSRLRLFRHNLLRAGGGWFDRHHDELNRVSQLRSARSWQMDHGLRARRSHVRSDRRATTRYDAIRSLHRQVGAALVCSLPPAARV